jgi:hypothetical protein
VPRALLLGLALGVAAAGCEKPSPTIRTCADSVRGIWRLEADPARAYHIQDLGDRVHLYPMWDATVPPGGEKVQLGAEPDETTPILAPPLIELLRDGERLEGTSKWRVTRPAKGGPRTCLVTEPAKLVGCAGGQATFSVQPAVEVDRETCQATLGDAWVDVALRRD